MLNKILNKTGQYFTTVFSFVIIFCTFFEAAAQQPIFNDRVFYELETNANKMLEEKNFRQTNIRETFEGGGNVPVEYEKSINEVLHPNRSHFIFEKKTADGTLRKEYIDIGRDRFIRENGGEWKIFEGSGGGIGSGSSGGVAKIESTTEDNFTAGEMLDGQKTDHYERIIRYTYTYPTKIEKITITQGFWFNADGLFVKTLYETRNETDKRIERETNFFEYNVDLKIEPPIIRKRNNDSRRKKTKQNKEL